MKLEEQLTALELSQKLNDLGVKQESLWRWHRLAGYRYKNETKETISESWIVGDKDVVSFEQVSAFSVAELGEILNRKVPKYDSWHKKWFFDSCSNNKTTMTFPNEWLPEDIKTEANARASMLCWLIENKKVKV